jgi:phosphoribosylformylglycinamidine cyclo-ligase
MLPIDYNSAGVSIERGDAFADYIRNIKSTAIPASIGGFAGGFEIDNSMYKNPVIFTTTDGVGTKLLVAKMLNRFDTLGIDLVAMCVNDLLVCGAVPQVFLDYIACGKINSKLLKNIMQGIVRGCEIAGCTLSGGETAEMPDVYHDDDFDLAGFSVGIAEKKNILPKTDSIRAGDIIYGLPSNGIHSNGLSLARKIVQPDNDEAWKELLNPTKIYTREFSCLLPTVFLKAAAHITGGGLIGNITRVLPAAHSIHLNWEWKIPWIFNYLQNEGSLDSVEMHRVFNMGIGIALIVGKENKDDFENFCSKKSIGAEAIGKVTHG